MAVQASRRLFNGLCALGLEHAALLEEAGSILPFGRGDIQLHGEVQVPCQYRQQSQRVLAFLLQYPDDFASVGGPAREEFCHQLKTVEAGAVLNSLFDGVFVDGGAGAQ